MIDPWELSVKELVRLWETTPDDHPIKETINYRLDYIARDSSDYSWEFFFDRNNQGKTSTIYFLPRSESFQMYGKYVTVRPEFSFYQIEQILEDKHEGCASFGMIRAKTLIAPHFHIEKVELMRTVGFNPIHVYDVQ